MCVVQVSIYPEGCDCRVRGIFLEGHNGAQAGPLSASATAAVERLTAGRGLGSVGCVRAVCVYACMCVCVYVFMCV